METPATIQLVAERDSSVQVRMAAVAWVLTAVYYFYQYALRSAPAVMMPELGTPSATRRMGVRPMVGSSYYDYYPSTLFPEPPRNGLEHGEPWLVQPALVVF